jgi:aminoglycoside phosphotransferase family enzyme
MSKGEKQPFVADMCNQGSCAQTLLRNERHNAQLEEDQPFHWREGKDDTGQGLHKRGDQEMLDNLNKMLDSFIEEEKMIRREREKEEMTTIKCSAGESDGG